MLNSFLFTFSEVATLAAAGAFLIGSLINASAIKPIRDEFVRYGFPWWWCFVTAILEFLTACLLVMGSTFAFGAILGVCIMVAAIVAVIRARDFGHILPPAAFLTLLLIAIFAHTS